MNRVLAALFVCAQINAAQERSYATAYPVEYGKALEFYYVNRAVIDSITRIYEVDPLLAFSIVAPETGRYLKWRDAFETSVVEMFYVQMGSDYNDYSIGPFQMKAEFAEKVEEQVAEMALSERIKKTFRYTENTEVKVRQARIDRLKTVEGSTQYLCGFILVFLKANPKRQHVSELPLVAAAYNYGFWKNRCDIENHIERRSFPESDTQTSFSYASVALYYYGQVRKK